MRTIYTLYCGYHGEVTLDNNEYMRQLLRPDDRWLCPMCNEVAEFHAIYESCRMPGCKGMVNVYEGTPCDECNRGIVE